jgi:hypothetical protein
VTIESYNVYSRAIKVPEVQFVKVKTVTDLLDLSYIELVPSENIGYVYEFYATAINEVGEGVPSSIAQIIAGTVPSAPLSVSKVTADIDQITISWSAPSDNGGTPILDY